MTIISTIVGRNPLEEIRVAIIVNRRVQNAVLGCNLKNDRKCMELTEPEDIKKSWQEYTEKLYKKKNLHDPDNHNGVLTYLEPESVLPMKFQG